MTTLTFSFLKTLKALFLMGKFFSALLVTELQWVVRVVKGLAQEHHIGPFYNGNVMLRIIYFTDTMEEHKDNIRLKYFKVKKF